MPLSCLDAHFVLFADYMVCLAHLSKLQSVCNAVYSWFIFNRLAVNIGKTKLCFSHWEMLLFQLCIWQELSLNVSRNLNFLAVLLIIICFGLHILILNQKRLLRVLIAQLKCFLHISPLYVRRMIYFAFMYPYLIYCLAIWGSVAIVHVHNLKF